MLDAQRGQYSREFRCGFVDFVVGVGFGDDASAGVGEGAAPIGGQLRAANRHYPAPVAADVTPAHGAGIETAVSSSAVISSHACVVGTPPTAGVGCNANAKSIAVVDLSRNRPLIGVLRCHTVGVRRS